MQGTEHIDAVLARGSVVRALVSSEAASRGPGTGRPLEDGGGGGGGGPLQLRVLRVGTTEPVTLSLPLDAVIADAVRAAARAWHIDEARVRIVSSGRVARPTERVRRRCSARSARPKPPTRS